MNTSKLLEEYPEAPAAQVVSSSDESSETSHAEGEAIPPLAAGSLLAPGYRVVDHLHRTSLFDVYDVWSDTRQCSCVAKALRVDWLDDAHEQRRLRREARFLQRFSHPHLVRAYEMIEDPRPVMILETLTGDTLEMLLENRQRRLPFSDVVYLGLHLCSAIHYLHWHRLLHLDLKPSNIISNCGTAKVLDLSLARPPGRYHRGVGTRFYMAPEQARGGMLGAAADVWGIGVVLFEAASGIRPFTTHDRQVKYPQLERRAAPIRAYRRVPALFARAVDGCLEPDPRQRPGVDELASVLQELSAALEEREQEG